jgi:hypothetical protein
MALNFTEGYLKAHSNALYAYPCVLVQNIVGIVHRKIVFSKENSMSFLSELFGATLGALIFGSLVYKGMSSIIKKIIKNPRTCYLISITLAILTLSAVSAWGNSRAVPQKYESKGFPNQA